MFQRPNKINGFGEKDKIIKTTNLHNFFLENSKKSFEVYVCLMMYLSSTFIVLKWLY